MTALDRLIKAEGVQGGVIHSYNRIFGEDVSNYGPQDLAELARRMMDMGRHDAATLASRASVAHLQISK